MRPVAREEILDLTAYEKARPGIRESMLAVKAPRRVHLGEALTFLFENRETVLFQIQEMVRTERIVDDAKVQEEVDAYNALIPAAGELSATLFIELQDLHLMNNDQVKDAVNRFQGIDREGVYLAIGDQSRIPARFEEGHSKEEKMAAVHYLRFVVPPGAASLLAAGGAARVVVDHPRYQAESPLSEPVRAELLKDLEIHAVV